MSSDAQIYGGAQFRTLAAAATAQLTYYGARVQTIKTTGAGVVINLPSVLGELLGGPILFILNDPTSTHLITIKDFGGATLKTISVGNVGIVTLYRNDTTSGKWHIRVLPLNASRTVTHATRISVLSSPAVCNPAAAIMVRCDDPTYYAYVDEVAAAPYIGRVIKVGSTPKCYRVYSVRRSGIHPNALPTVLADYASCRSCLRTLGVISGGDADDSPYDPSTPSTGGSRPTLIFS